ncbi:MAG: hypothetical protein HKO79_04810 [Desulfobacterales bacterium]|nr:hypothetical protein [Deltaproteobacteria bacterium]NNL41792.1 hypothetical protein [Desulfobacterales bacterium]
MKHKIAIFLPLLLIVLFSIPLCAETSAGDIIVESDGFGLSKKDALLKAKREAVEIGIGTILYSQTEIKNFELQKDVILTKTVGSVKKYDILHQEKKSDNTFHVKIQAVVSLADIKADLAALKILLESMDKPRMMVLIREKNARNSESAIIDYLTKKGVELVDPAVVASLMNKNDRLIKRAAEGDPAAASQIGTSNGAEYILVGKVIKSTGENALLKESGLVSGQASITAKVVNCSNGKIIASKSTNSAAAHISEKTARNLAAEKAGKKLMDQQLFEAIVTSFQDMVNNGMPLDVTIKQVSNFQTQKALRQTLGNFSGVVSVTKRSFGNGRLKLTILYKGSADSFCEMVDGNIFRGKKLSVIDSAGSRVVILLK